MASANQTLSASGKEFECDNTERLATISGVSGGYVRNLDGTVTAYLNVDGGTVATSNPTGDSGRSIPPGKVIALPNTCRTFSFKSASSIYLAYSKNPSF